MHGGEGLPAPAAVLCLITVFIGIVMAGCTGLGWMTAAGILIVVLVGHGPLMFFLRPVSTPSSRRSSCSPFIAVFILKRQLHYFFTSLHGCGGEEGGLSALRRAFFYSALPRLFHRVFMSRGSVYLSICGVYFCFAQVGQANSWV